MTIVTLKRPADFKRVRGGLRWATPLFIMEGRRRPDSVVAEAPMPATGARFGFTITRKVGGAVIRNRIRRRLKEALRTLGADGLRPDHDYVVVASRAVHDYPFAGLQDALREALERLHRQVESKVGRRGGRRGKEFLSPPASDRPGAADSSPGNKSEPRPASEPDASPTRAGPGRQVRRQRH